jgi:hypothetical protein
VFQIYGFYQQQKTEKFVQKTAMCRSFSLDFHEICKKVQCNFAMIIFSSDKMDSCSLFPKPKKKERRGDPTVRVSRNTLQKQLH